MADAETLEKDNARGSGQEPLEYISRNKSLLDECRERASERNQCNRCDRTEHYARLPGLRALQLLRDVYIRGKVFSLVALERYSRQNKYTIRVSSIYPVQLAIKGTYGFVVLRFRIDNTAHCLCIMKWRSDKPLNVYTLISTGRAGTSIPSNFCRGFASVGVISRNKFLLYPFVARDITGHLYVICWR